MTPTAIIEQATADGVHLSVSTAGTIKATGDRATVDRWIPHVREHKLGIIAALIERASNPATAHERWLVTYRDRRTVEVVCCPDATRADVLLRPDAVAADPIAPAPRRRATASEEKALRQAYDVMAERNSWPMPDTWYGDREAILSDPDAALVTLQNLIREVGQ